MTPKELDQFICVEFVDKYLSEKDHTGKPMVDGEGKPIYKQDEKDEKRNQPTLDCSDIVKCTRNSHPCNP